MLRHYQNLVNHASENPQIQANQLDIFTREERQNLLYKINAHTPVHQPTPIVEQVRACMQRYANRTALVVYRDGSYVPITFAQLDEQSNRLAYRLWLLGAAPEVPVALIHRRSADLIIGLLAIFKCGAT